MKSSFCTRHKLKLIVHVYRFLTFPENSFIRKLLRNKTNLQFLLPIFTSKNECLQILLYVRLYHFKGFIQGAKCTCDLIMLYPSAHWLEGVILFKFEEFQNSKEIRLHLLMDLEFFELTDNILRENFTSVREISFVSNRTFPSGRWLW